MTLLVGLAILRISVPRSRVADVTLSTPRIVKAISLRSASNAAISFYLIYCRRATERNAEGIPRLRKKYFSLRTFFMAKDAVYTKERFGVFCFNPKVSYTFFVYTYTNMNIYVWLMKNGCGVRIMPHL